MDKEDIEEAIEVLEDASAEMLTETGEENYYGEAIAVLRQALETDLARVGEVGVWGVVQCEPQEALEDGWCDWVCPKPQGYLMQCCDCELIHEVDFRVVQYEPKPSEMYEVVDDPNLQAQMRLRRRDDLLPKRQWVGLTDDAVFELADTNLYDGGKNYGVLAFAKAIEQALKDKNHG